MKRKYIKNSTRINVEIDDSIYIPFRVHCLKNKLEVKQVITDAIIEINKLNNKKKKVISQDC